MTALQITFLSGSEPSMLTAHSVTLTMGKFCKRFSTRKRKGIKTVQPHKI